MESYETKGRRYFGEAQLNGDYLIGDVGAELD
jgi:hypothetical protein